MSKKLRIISKLRHLAGNESGGTLAELAIIVPFLVVMLAAVSEVGRFFQTYTTLSKTTRSAARYLSSHQFNDLEKGRAKNLVVCGKLTCNGGDELVKGLTTANVCIQTTLTASSTVETVTVNIPRAETVTCEDGGSATWLVFNPIFDIGALLNNDTFSLEYPISPSTTMRYIPAE
jgi:Flp pilus assembly protein TadG